MTKMTIVSTFDDKDIAEKAIDTLRNEGFPQQDITILDADADKLRRDLTQRGFGEADASFFAQAAGQGKTLVSASVPEDRAEHAAALMARFETAHDGDTGGEEVMRREETVPIVEEQFSVGKAKAVTGGTRVTSRLREQPVEETVTLREELVDAERLPADRALSADEASAAFEEKSIEMMGTREEAEIRKEARVVGEVSLTKATQEREQTVRDTVRRTEVEIEKIDSGSTKRK